MKSQRVDLANALSGGLFIAVGLVFAAQALRLDTGGGGARLGPGSFPLFLAGLLTILGLIVLLAAFRRPGEPIEGVSWRGLAFVLPAPLIFALTVRGLGFVPALFLTALMACFASSKMRPLLALAIAGGITVFSTLLFSYGLDLPYPLFGTWLGR